MSAAAGIAARPISRWTMPNGLRVVVLPQPASGAACVAVCYGVGFRHEKPGQSGFAHLFEHLMTQGSRNLAKLEQKYLLEREGGWYSGQTRHDYTGYQSTIPAAAVGLALWCEAERMAGLRLSAENLVNQVAVVKQEIEGNILSQPYGGFPYFQVDAALFDSFANTHDGYGAFADLDRITVEDAEQFFANYYTPQNAVIAIAGDVLEEPVQRDVERYFGSIEGGPAPVPPALGEPPLTQTRRVHHCDARARDSAVALGFRTPDPVHERDDYLRLRLLARIVGDGPRSRLGLRLVGRERAATSIVAELGSLGDWMGTCAPAQLAIGIRHRTEIPVDSITHMVDEELTTLVDTLSDSEVASVGDAHVAAFERAMTYCYASALAAAECELICGDGTRLDHPLAVWSDIDAATVRDLARRWLVDPARVEIVLTPGTP